MCTKKRSGRNAGHGNWHVCPSSNNYQRFNGARESQFPKRYPLHQNLSLPHHSGANWVTGRVWRNSAQSECLLVLKYLIRVQIYKGGSRNPFPQRSTAACNESWPDATASKYSSVVCDKTMTSALFSDRAELWRWPLLWCLQSGGSDDTHSRAQGTPADLWQFYSLRHLTIAGIVR